MAQHTQSTTAARARGAAAARRDTGMQEFLDGLAKALTSGDTARVAEMWKAPALVLGDGGEHLVQSDREVEEFFAGAKGQYNARGITDTHADIQYLHWLTPRMAVAEVRWPYLDASGKEVGEETSTYVLKRDEVGELKLRVALMHGEGKAKTH